MTSFAIKAGAAIVGVSLLGAGAAAGLSRVITGDWEAAGKAFSNLLSNDNAIKGCITRDDGHVVPVTNNGMILNSYWVEANEKGDTCAPGGASDPDGTTWPMLDGKDQPYAAQNDKGYSLGTDDLIVKPSSDITLNFNDETVATVNGDDYFIEGVVPENTDIKMDNGRIIIELEGQEPVTVDCNHAVITPQNTVEQGLSCGM